MGSAVAPEVATRRGVLCTGAMGVGIALAEIGVSLRSAAAHKRHKRRHKRCKKHCKGNRRTCNRGCDILDGDSKEFCKQGCKVAYSQCRNDC